MTAESRPAAGRGERLRLALRLVCSAVALLVVYATLPFDRPTVGTLVWLAIGLVAFVVILVWQVRSIVRSPYPVLRAVEAFVTAPLLFIVLFAGGYVALAHADPASFSQPLNRVGGLYFTMTVLATVGFGDIVPTSDTARVVTIVQMIVGFTFVGLVGRQFLSAVGQAHHRSGVLDPDRPPTEPGPPE